LRKTLRRDGKDTAKEKADDEGKTPTTTRRRRRRRRRRTEDDTKEEEEEKKEEQKRFKTRGSFQSSRGKDVHIIIIVLVRVVKNNFSALFVNLNFVFRVLSRDIFRERDFINHPPFLDVHEDVSLVILM
jgi:hypothetical protein